MVENNDDDDDDDDDRDGDHTVAIDRNQGPAYRGDVEEKEVHVLLRLLLLLLLVLLLLLRLRRTHKVLRRIIIANIVHSLVG